ncbi:MAG: hypothetical protein OXN44_07825 [Acidimicrobiaceae bacterium]|nr:hypothetical protein [Acidimicrobiaceae bacterium]
MQQRRRLSPSEHMQAIRGSSWDSGDVITSEAQDIGTMANRCVRVGDHATL